MSTYSNGDQETYAHIASHMHPGAIPPLGVLETQPGNGVPPWVSHLYGVSNRRLSVWRTEGWLGIVGHGEGFRYPWTDPDVAAQIEWLRRLAASGRVLDGEDAAAGFRLRTAGIGIAIRVGAEPWQAWDGQPAANVHTIATVRPLVGLVGS